MTFYSITLFISSFINLFLGLFVFTKNVKSEKNKAFALFETCIAIWGVGMLMMTLSKDKQMAMLGITILHLGLFFGFPSFFNFVLAIIDDKSKINKTICFIGYSIGLFFNLIDKIKSTAIVSDVTIIFGTYQPVAGPSAPLFNFVFLSFLSYGILLLYKGYRKTDSLLEKNRLKYIFTGMFITILTSITNIFLVMGIKVYPIAHISLNIYACMIAYAIVKYRLMDITIIIRKGLLYALLTALITGIWLSSIFILEGFLCFQSLYARTLTVIFIIFIFQPIRERIELIIDKMFYRERYDLQEVLKKVSKNIPTIIERETLLSSTLDVIMKSIHPEYAVIMLLDESKERYKPAFGLGNYNPVFIGRDDTIIKWFNREKRELLHEEAIENPEFNGVREAIINFLEQIKTILSIPLFFKEELIGILNLGPKLGEKPYNHDEIAFLSTLSNEMALALENTKLFTQIKQKMIELEKLTYQLKIANESKSTFLNIVSHELRTPLTVIMGYVGLLSQKALGEITETQKKSIEIIMDKCRHLNELIGDILDLSKIERGKRYEFKKQPVDFKKVIEDVVLIFTPHAHQKQIKIQSEIDPNIPMVMYDYERAKEIFSKLVDNAIKFIKKDSKGWVTIRLEDKGQYLEGSVEDNGIGIKKENFEKIFERFYQLDMSDTRSYEGTGLGLAIVKEIVEDSAGSIKVESQKGLGSKFIFTLPKEVVEEENLSKIKLQGKQPQGIKVLIVEDDIEISRMVELYLKLNAFQKIEIAKDGLEAINKLYQEKPNLVICNLRVPKVDGYELAHILRDHEETKEIPLIMLVPVSEEENLDKIYKAGATIHLFKPFDFKDLMEKIASMLAE